MLAESIAALRSVTKSSVTAPRLLGLQGVSLEQSFAEQASQLKVGGL